jgi:hypothetical protein
MIAFFIQVGSYNAGVQNGDIDGGGTYYTEASVSIPTESSVTSTPEPTQSYTMDKESYENPYNTMSVDCGAEIYDSGFVYYEIPKEYKKEGGCFPEIVQLYLWNLCKEKDIDYYIVLSLIERESGYRYDCIGDDGNSLGYMQIYKKYHKDRMKEQGVDNLLDPYGNIRVGIDYLCELYEKYGSSGDNCVLMVYNMGECTAKKLWKNDIYSSEYSRVIVKRSQEIKQELVQE